MVDFPFLLFNLGLIMILCIDWKTLFLPDAAIGFNVETVQYKNIKFQVWDLGTCQLIQLLVIHVKFLLKD